MLQGSYAYMRFQANRPLGYERVYLPLCKVADTPFHIQGDEMSDQIKQTTIAKIFCGRCLIVNLKIQFERRVFLHRYNYELEIAILEIF